MSTPQVLRSSNASSNVQSTNGSMKLPQKKGQPTVVTSSTKGNQNTQQKKIPRKSSKPIINWFQRKLAGTGKVKRTENLPHSLGELGHGQPSQHPRAAPRAASSPLPQSMKNPVGDLSKRESVAATRRTTFSLTEDEESRDYQHSFIDDGTSVDGLSFAPDSLWSPASALEADDDASLRPIPPSAPPSPSPSRSSSSYLSDPRTFRSIAASTKPTTVLSIDLGGNGMAHIAQVPPNAPTNPVHRIAPHIRQSSSLSSPGHVSSHSMTFSSIPYQQPSSRPSSVQHPGSISSLNFAHGANYSPVTPSPVHIQAPLHTAPHPRNNPRPSSPPLDNASILTLASSAYAMPQRGTLTAYSIPASALGDNASHYNGSMIFPDGESTSHFILGDDDRLDERDVNASVRALRPRSSRRGSWESEMSRWSARVLPTGTPSLARERSLWTTNSIRTGMFSTENGEIDQREDDSTAFDGDKASTGPDIALYRASPVDSSDPELAEVLVGKPPVGKKKSADPNEELLETLGRNGEVGQTFHHRGSTETIAQASPIPNDVDSGELSDPRRGDSQKEDLAKDVARET